MPGPVWRGQPAQLRPAKARSCWPWLIPEPARLKRARCCKFQHQPPSTRATFPAPALSASGRRNTKGNEAIIGPVEQVAARAAQVVCFPRGRIHFLAPSGGESTPRKAKRCSISEPMIKRSVRHSRSSWARRRIERKRSRLDTDRAEKQFLNDFTSLRDQLPREHKLIRRRVLHWRSWGDHGAVRLSVDGEITLTDDWLSAAERVERLQAVRAGIINWLRNTVEDSRASTAKGVTTRARRRAARLKAVTAKWLAGEGAAYANRKKCACCDKVLTDPESRARGIGPECWELILKMIARRRARLLAWGGGKNDAQKMHARSRDETD
jgi:Family of unknown function (DUF6011)